MQRTRRPWPVAASDAVIILTVGTNMDRDDDDDLLMIDDDDDVFG